MIRFKPAIARELLRDSMLPAQMMGAFDSLLNESFGRTERTGFFVPKADISETEKQFRVNIALPGMKKEEIAIDVDKNVLTISGEYTKNTEEKDVKYHAVENVYGKFSRKFTLPENADKENISASYTDGMLQLEIPKSEVKDSKTRVAVK